MPVQRKTVSIVVPMLNESACIPKLHDELRRHCDPLDYDFEFVMVDDGSTDATAVVLAQRRALDSRLKYISFSRNFGHQAAINAGLAYATGDAVITMDGDLQHPPSMIPQLLELWEAGNAIVNTTRLKTDETKASKKLFAWSFYKAFRWLSGVTVKPGSADFRLMSRQAVNIINELPERHRFLRGLIPWMGFQQANIDYVAPNRFAGSPKYTFTKSFMLALDGITSFSLFPLRKLTIFGWMVTMASVLYGFFAIAVGLFTKAAVPGWTSLMVCTLFFGGAQMVSFGLLGEYIGRILEQVKGRPLFIVDRARGFEESSEESEAPARTVRMSKAA